MKRFQLTIEHIILIITAVLTALSISWCWASPVARALRNGTPINGLIIGTDLVDYARHSDTLIFARYVPEEQFLNIISIPRDTHFSPPGYHFRRINEVFAYHYRTKKSDRAACHEVIAAVELLLQNRAVIPFYVQINYASFRTFIDLIGGITVDIDEPMHYDDNAGNLHIHFEPGKQHLNGQQALEYVRYRGKAGDLGRVFRQQRFIKAVLARFKNPVTVLRLPQIVRTVTADIHTNLSFWDLLTAVMELKDLKPADIRLAQLPGEPRGDYWEIDDQNCTGLFDRIFVTTGTPASQTVMVGPRVRVEVWNASGKNKLADRVNWMLRKQGYDVVEWGTISVNQKKSIIKDLTGNLRPAQRIADILQCGEVITRYDARRLVDISVILGEDCVLPEPEKPRSKAGR
jgi:LCP family protein required for cell wall assembly